MSLEKLYMIEVRDAFKDNPECPFCSLEALLEKQALEFTLRFSYMESYVREQTDQMGFCTRHFPDLLDACEQNLNAGEKEEYIPVNNSSKGKCG